ncbi:WD repeat-containing protein 74 [Rhizopus stolonifer]|uniref:Ribosome biogenesis protein NSA1 n=1 Tax=Rhizopus stolonifer TaxID=4846 RepID=A0A367JRB8_RHIST|nr:WD repeat-containing protein 74 [Rhizopus stolonifer]
MKYFTGDESGLIKWISFPPKIEEKPQKRVKQNNNDDDEKDKKKDTLQPLTGIFGKVDKAQAVQKLAWAQWQDEKVLLVGRKNGVIQFMSPESGAILKEFRNKHVGTDEKQGYFVGLYVHNNHLCACTSTGDFSYTPLDADKTETETLIQLGSQLEIMRPHPTHSHLFAIGGKDHDLCIYDLNLILNQQEVQETHQNTSTHKKKSDKSVGRVFQAKNVKNDFLDLQQPVWIHDLQFVNKEGTQVALVTHYHQFRVYDTKKARRPILSVEVGKHPLKVLSMGPDDDHVLFSDTMSTVGMLHIQTGKRAAQFKGFSGAATDIVYVSSPQGAPVVVSTSLDRFLRVHETSTVYRHLVDKAYLKQRLTCVLVDTSFEYPVPKIKTEQEEEEEEEDAMWDAMALVQDHKRKHT